VPTSFLWDRHQEAGHDRKKTINGPKGDEVRGTVRRKPLSDPDSLEGRNPDLVDLFDDAPDHLKGFYAALLRKHTDKPGPLRKNSYQDRCKVHEVALRLHKKHPEMRAQKIAEHEKIIKIVGRYYYNTRTVYNWVLEVVKFPPGRPKKN
jgi:hypothetical protein